MFEKTKINEKEATVGPFLKSGRFQYQRSSVQILSSAILFTINYIERTKKRKKRQGKVQFLINEDIVG